MPKGGLVSLIPFYQFAEEFSKCSGFSLFGHSHSATKSIATSHLGTKCALKSWPELGCNINRSYSIWSNDFSHSSGKVKAMPRRIALACAAICAAFALCVLSFAQDPPKGRQYTPPNYVFSPDVPKDLVVHDVGAIGFQPFVDILAWDTFVAMNWPVPNPIVERGVPDPQNVIGGLVSGGGEGGKPSVMHSGPTVWETYKDTNDIYLPSAARPTSFDTPESVPPACKPLAAANRAAAKRTLILTSKFGEIVSSVKQADGNRLVDQNGSNVWYEVKLNRVYYDYVVSNGFYNSNNQKGKTISFPASSNNRSRDATIKVKAAWKVMGLLGSKQPDDPTKFYTTDALVLDPVTGKCSKQLLGLVGLHIVSKTAQLPQWMWATFEHVDNVPDQNGRIAGKRYNFFNSNCPSCPVNQPPATGSMTPTQVVRVVPVNNVAASNNALYQAALRTLRADNVWQYYQLVDAQWGASPTPIGEPNQPKFLANTTQETYLQEQREPHGCINCHGFAKATDLDFQLTHAYPRPPSHKKLHESIFKVPGVATPRPK